VPNSQGPAVVTNNTSGASKAFNHTLVQTKNGEFAPAATATGEYISIIYLYISVFHTCVCLCI